MKRLLILIVVLVSLALAPSALASPTACSDVGFTSKVQRALAPALSSMDYIDAGLWREAELRLVSAQRSVLRAPMPCRAVLRNARALTLAALSDWRRAVVAGRQGNRAAASMYVARGTARLNDAINRLRYG